MELEPLGDLLDIPEHFILEQQNTLDITITELLKHKRPLSFSQSAAYQACETLCLLGREDHLLRRLETQTEEHIQEAVRSMFVVSPSEEDPWLPRLISIYSSIDESLTDVEFIMAPLDRGYVLNTDAECIRCIVQRQLSKALQNAPTFLPLTLQAVLLLINAHRTGTEKMTPQIQYQLERITGILDWLELYNGEFEDVLLTASRSFYDAEAKFMTDDINFSAAKYIQHICNRLSDETEVIARIIQPHTVPSLNAVILDELLKKHSKKILVGEPDAPHPEEGLYQLLVLEDVDTLKKLHSLFLQTENREELRLAWQSAIKAEGARLLQEKITTTPISFSKISSNRSDTLLTPLDINSLGKTTAQQKTLVYELIKFKLFLASILENVFGNAEDFDEAWEFFLNATPELANTVACFVAKYTDELLRAGAPTFMRHTYNTSTIIPREDIDVHLDRVISIFKVLQAKDVFKAFYEKDLGRRLLLGRSTSLDHEKLFVKKLRAECGPAYTSRMESMFRELELSKATYSQLRQDSESQTIISATGIQFECHVLASGIWPTPLPPNTALEILLPSPMITLQEAYSNFYKKLQKGRNLAWAPSLGSCIVRAYYDIDINTGQQRKHDLVLTQHQAVCLLLFNEADVLAVDEISRSTNIPVDELHRHLLALYVDPKKRILHKLPESTREIAGTDTYRVNVDFTSKLLRIVINQIMLKDSKEEVEQTEKRVEEDRTYHIDALIVRIMKANKEMQHNALMSDVLKNVLFKTSPSIIKTRIETLIDREFLGRSADDPYSYKYLA